MPYEYQLHEVHLDSDEMDRYVELTEKIRKLGFKASDDGRDAVGDPYLASLLRERRAVLEYVDEKLAVLRRLLMEIGPAKVARTLIYVSAEQTPPGKRRQIEVPMLCCQSWELFSNTRN